jgi:hypothetical protein
MPTIDPTSLATFSLRIGVFGLLVVAVRRGNTAAAINAFAALVLALAPSIVEVVLEPTPPRSSPFGPVLPVWLGVAGFLHSLGMLGPYDSRWWWDHLTHTVSAALVGALVYAGVVVTLPDTVGTGRSAGVIAAVVGFTFAIGVFWELVELVARELGELYDIEPVLVHYGWDDTAADLVFDVVGAVLVLAFDLRVFVPVVERFPGVAGAALVGSVWVVVVGSVAMALVVGLGADARP